MYEPYIPFWKKKMPYTILSFSVVLLLVIVAIGSVFSVIIYRATIRATIRSITMNSPNHTISSYYYNNFFYKYSAIITPSSAAGLNLMVIMVLNLFYSRLAYFLTDLEMPRTQTEFDNSLTLKMFLLQFVNYYSSIFYIAFFKGKFIGHPGQFRDKSLTQEECATGGCLLELAIQLSIIMVGKQAMNGLIEMISPTIKTVYKRFVFTRKTKINNNEVKPITSLPQWEDDFFLKVWQPTSLFYEYLEMVLQFGFVTIFVAAFPLAPLFALINNTFEIRLDAKKIITSYRRPVAQRVKSIGIWYTILDTIATLSVVTNAIIIAFTTDFIPRLMFYFENGNLTGYLNSTLSFYNGTEINEHLKLELVNPPELCL